MKKNTLLLICSFLAGMFVMAQTANTKNNNKTISKPEKSAEVKNAKPVFSFTNDVLPDSSFRVRLTTPSYKEGLAYLCYHFGKNLNIEDSAYIDDKGEATFSGNRLLLGGIYAIVFPGKSVTFDFFVDKNQDISIYADVNDLQNVVIKGSDENKLFRDYQKFIMVKGGMLQDARTSYASATNKSDSAFHEARYSAVNKEMNDYRDSIMKNHSASMMALFLNAMREPEIIHKQPKTRQDSIDNYDNYKAHYFDGITFRDERVLRTPFFMPKFEKYYNDIIIQAADTLIKDIDYRLLLARTCPEMYRFLLNWYTDYYLNPKYMGHDAVFVHLFEKYHSKGLSNWLNEKQMETITRRAYMQMANLLGAQGSNLEMVDSSGKRTDLYDVKADYTLICFWDPSCGHCKEELPRIDSIYRASWKKKGVKIYAVLNDHEKKKDWVNYIKEHKMGDWLHVYETPEKEKEISDSKRPSYRQLYDVTQTPTILMLDKDKRIIGKRLSFLQLNDMLEARMKNTK